MMYRTLSCIDMVLSTEDSMPFSGYVRYLPCAISEYSPLERHLDLGSRPALKHWKMDAQWLQEECI